VLYNRFYDFDAYVFFFAQKCVIVEVLYLYGLAICYAAKSP
jgi:hypothetical protein